MKSSAPDSEDPYFRFRVGAACLVLSALVGTVHGRMVAEAEARRADPDAAEAADKAASELIDLHPYVQAYGFDSRSPATD